MGIFLKSACVLCGDSVSRAISLCEACENNLPVLDNACQQCGLPVASDIKNSAVVCGQCVQSPPPVDYTVCAYHYETPLDYLLTELKYNKKLSHAKIMSQLFLAHLENSKSTQSDKNDFPDVILPVPLHKSRLIKRGFNQSLELAKPIAKYLDIPITLDLVIRKRKTRAQTDLSAIERQKNIRGCFHVQTLGVKKDKEKMSAYKHIVIIDDVVTTGSTINELAKQLKKSGVKKVGVWSIARALAK